MAHYIPPDTRPHDDSILTEIEIDFDRTAYLLTEQDCGGQVHRQICKLHFHDGTCQAAFTSPQAAKFISLANKYKRSLRWKSLRQLFTHRPMTLADVMAGRTS